MKGRWGNTGEEGVGTKQTNIQRCSTLPALPHRTATQMKRCRRPSLQGRNLIKTVKNVTVTTARFNVSTLSLI